MSTSTLTRLGLALIMGVLLLSGCGSASSTPASPMQSTPTSHTPMSMDQVQMPDYVQSASPAVQAAYYFAVTHPHALETVPCYCGCGRIGHRNNLDCFLKPSASDSSLNFEPHAAYCGICVDISNDVARLNGEGKTSRKIRSYIDARYSASGPSTDTAMPTD
jgi:uncharacterized protein YceK